MLQTTQAVRDVRLSRMRRRHPLRPPREVDFRKLLGIQEWALLPLAVRDRFDVRRHRRAVTYEGSMEVVRASAWGRVIAQVCRLIGTPLAPFTGRDVPLTVTVYPDGLGGIVWDRTYRFPGRPPLPVTSSKALDGEGQLMEVVRGGLGMRLALSVEDHALHFRSVGYFVTLGAVRLPIPDLLTPGEAHVIHADVGGACFRFTLGFVHSWLGETFFQTGLFRDPKEARPS
jgi:hypothetical protein